MTDYLAKMQDLKQRHSSLEREYVRLQARLEELERQKQQIISRFKELGYNDVNAVPAALADMEARLDSLLSDIESALTQLEG